MLLTTLIIKYLKKKQKFKEYEKITQIIQKRIQILSLVSMYLVFIKFVILNKLLFYLY